MVSKIIYILFLLCLMLQSCTKDTLSSSEFIAYVDDSENNFVQQREFNNITYTLKQEPIQYKAIKELTFAKKQITQSVFDSLAKQYEGLVYFTFKMESLSNSEISPIKSLAHNADDMAKIKNYCLSKLQNDFYIESNNAQFDCVLFHLEDDHNITNCNVISIAFDADSIDITKDVVFAFNDPFFNSGVIKFNIPKESFNHIPKIKFT